MCRCRVLERVPGLTTVILREALRPKDLHWPGRFFAALCFAQNDNAKLRVVVKLVLLVSLALAVPGCQQEMANQPRYDAMEPLPELAEGAKSLGPIQGTVARGLMQSNDAYFTGKQLDQLVTEIPGRALEGRSMEE